MPPAASAATNRGRRTAARGVHDGSKAKAARATAEVPADRPGRARGREDGGYARGRGRDPQGEGAGRSGRAGDPAEMREVPHAPAPAAARARPGRSRGGQGRAAARRFQSVEDGGPHRRVAGGPRRLPRAPEEAPRVSRDPRPARPAPALTSLRSPHIPPPLPGGGEG